MGLQDEQQRHLHSGIRTMSTVVRVRYYVQSGHPSKKYTTKPSSHQSLAGQ